MSRNMKPDLVKQEASQQEASKQDVSVADEGGFLNRWSRLKRGRETVAQSVPETLPTQVHAEDDANAELELQARQDEIEAEIERKRAELIASLPQLDSITATTDVTGFMNALIPDALRNAGLRAAWSADPAIRDFLNDAREYALDYNTPGAAYGYGPLTEQDLAGLDDMVRGIFGDKPKQDEISSEDTSATDDTLVAGCTIHSSEISDISSQSVSVASQKLQDQDNNPQSVRLSEMPQEHPEILEKHDEVPQKQALDTRGDSDQAHIATHHNTHDVTASTSNNTTYRRRGGGAMPH